MRPLLPLEIIEAYKTAIERYEQHIEQKTLTNLPYFYRRIMRPRNSSKRINVSSHVPQ